MRLTLRLAAAYNVLWGAWVILLPAGSLALFGVDGLSPAGLAIWQCVGMIVGVYGVGYWVAADHPARHWPIVLVGMLGKVFGPLGFAQAVLIDGTFPLSFGLTIITNDLIWWVPFTLILLHAWREAERRRPTRGEVDSADVSDVLADVRTSDGVAVLELSRTKPALLVFLRHLGCTFCREAVADIARDRASIADDAEIVFVHMSGGESASGFFAEYGLEHAHHVADPDRHLYRAFGLERGTLGQLFGPHVWVRGFEAALLNRHWIGALQGDGFQMPGVFLVREGRVVEAFRHTDAADRPDYAGMARQTAVAASPG